MQPNFEKKMDSTPDTFNESVSSILERKVRGWLTGVFDDMRRSSPVQQWLDSLPADSETENQNETDIITDDEIKKLEQNRDSESKSDENKPDESITENTVVENEIHQDVVYDDKSLNVPAQREAWKRKSLESGVLTSTPHSRNVKMKLQRDHSVQSEGYTPRFKNPLFRDHSLQSDASGSSGSSVLNVLGARKVDAESVLLALGFGPSEKQQKLQRIPDRFLVPSKLKGISTEQFIKDEQHSMRMHDCGIFGYRGLTGFVTKHCPTLKIWNNKEGGKYHLCHHITQNETTCYIWNPHVPPSTIVAKIMDCILQDDVCREEALMKSRHSIADMRSPATIHAHLTSRLRST